jgi:formylmethanofuran dehydrogenase subunit E
MSADNPASPLGGICSECGKTSMDLMVSSTGKKLCADCCDDLEGGLETVAVEQLGAGFLAQLCQECFVTSGDLLPTAEGRMLCPECYWKEESQRSTLGPEPTTSETSEVSPPGVSAPEADFEAETTAEIPPVKFGGRRPGTCDECGQSTLKRVPSFDGRLLCEGCIAGEEEGKSTLAMPTSSESGLSSAINNDEGICQACNQISTGLLVGSDGRRLCADCYIDHE